MPGPVVLFDLDGTLIDPRPGIVGCLRYALGRLARACPPDDVLAAFIGPPLRGTFSTLLGTSDRGVIEEAMALYRERYAQRGLYEARVYDGIADMLGRVGSRASATLVATSKPTVYADRVVKHFGLRPHFAGVYGADLHGRFDDKSDLLSHVLATEGLRAEVTVMVGDRAVDVVAARANRVRSIGVLWGYGTARELTAAGADALCAAPAELPACLSRIAP